jgi:hypothetical protein
MPDQNATEKQPPQLSLPELRLEGWEVNNANTKLWAIDAFLFDIQMQVEKMKNYEEVRNWLADTTYEEVEKLDSPELLILYNLIQLQKGITDTINLLDKVVPLPEKEDD